MEQTPAQYHTAYRLTRRVRAGGSTTLAMACLLGGLLFLLFLWPLGVLLMLLALGLDRKYATAHYCGACGNDVAATSQMCPTCRSHLQGLPAGVRMKKALMESIKVIIILAVLVVAVTWLVIRAQR